MFPLRREGFCQNICFLRRERESDFAKTFVNIFSIQEKEDDTQDGIDQDQPLLLEQLTSLKVESTPSQDNRDIILDVTLFSENRAEVSIIYFIHFHGSFSSQNYICEDYNEELHDKFIGQYAYYYLDWYLQTYMY